MKKFLKNNPQLVIVFISTLLAGIVSVVLLSIMRIYYINYPIWVEQAAYLQFPSLTYLVKILSIGKFSALYQSLFTGEKHLLQILLFGLTYPRLLGWPYAHLIIIFIVFSIFLFTFIYFVYLRTKSLLYAVSLVFLYMLCRELFYERWGIGSGFSDYQSMYLLSAGILSLLIGFFRQSIIWIIFFSVFVSLAILARTTAVFYSILICAPILILYFMNEYNQNKNASRIFKIIATIFLIVFPFFLIFIVQLPKLLWYYGSVNAWNLRQSLVQSINNILVLFFNYTGITFVSVCAGLFLIRKLFITAKSDKRRESLYVDLSITWWMIGYIGFLLLNGYTSDVPKEVMYLVPAVILFSATPIVLKTLKVQRIYTILSLIIIILSIGSTIIYIHAAIRRVDNVPEDELQVLKSQVNMASKLAELPEGIRWQSYTFPDWGIPVTLQAYYRFGKIRLAQNDYFHNMESYWQARFPNYSRQHIEEFLYQKTLNCIDAAVVLDDYRKKPELMEEYSYLIARYISENIHTDNNWQLYGVISGEPYTDKLTIFLNNRKTQTCSPLYSTNN